jgi:hypothetical protein
MPVLLEKNLEDINKDHTEDHLDDTVEEYLTWLAEQNMDALRKHSEARIKEFEKEAEKARAFLTQRIKQLSK